MAHSTVAAAIEFLGRVGTGPISVQTFDEELIRLGLAKKVPADIDDDSQEFKGFVAQRSVAKRSLNAAAASLGDEAYVIKVRSPGKEYEVVPWNQGIDETAGTVGKKVDLYVENKSKTLAKSLRDTRFELERDPNNPELASLEQKLITAQLAGNRLTQHVALACEDYELALERAHEASAKLIQIGRDSAGSH